MCQQSPPTRWGCLARGKDCALVKVPCMGPWGSLKIRGCVQRHLELCAGDSCRHHRRCICSLWDDNHMAAVFGDTGGCPEMGLQKYKSKGNVQELWEDISYKDGAVFVEREITLTFVNKVRSLVLLSVGPKVILLLIWIIAVAVSPSLETGINKIHHPSLTKTYG